MIYDQKATEGLTAEDMVQAVSAQYGTATRPKTDISFPTKASYESKEKIIARWEDSQNSVNLFHSGTLDSFGLHPVFKTPGCRGRGCHHRIREAGKGRGSAEGDRAPEKEADDLEVARRRIRRLFALNISHPSWTPASTSGAHPFRNETRTCQFRDEAYGENSAGNGHEGEGVHWQRRRSKSDEPSR